MRLHLVTPPATEPVSLAEAKAHLRLEPEQTAEDAYLAVLIQAARQYAEEVCWRGLVTQKWEAVLEGFSGAEMELPRGHLDSIVSVTYVDEAGVVQTVAPATYEADTVSVPGRLLLAYGQSWPSARAQWNAVRVRYTVGWAAAEVPATIRQALLLLVAHLYEQRTPEVVGTIVSPVRFAVDSLLSPYRLVRL
jgi:uncharacterized phiE125 gp8 family phage protein